jgi:trk system potassium uptake protein TrkA
MYIVIAESGNLAQELVASFIASGDEVYILDNNEKLVKKIQSDFGMVAAVGDMMSIDDLTKAGVSRASIFIAGSKNDHNNLAACQLVTKHFETPRTISLFSNLDNTQVFDQSGVDVVINTTVLKIERLSSIIGSHPMMKLMDLPGGDKSVIAVKITENSNAIGKRVPELPLPPGSEIILIASENGTIQNDMEGYQLSVRDEIIILSPKNLETRIETILTRYI